MAVVRYADDFVVVCRSKEQAQGAIDRLTPWLGQRGLRLSQEKTQVVHIQEGFNFLGLNVRQYKAAGRKKAGAVLHIKPSRDSVRRIRARLREEWRNLRGHEVRRVVGRLNPIIRGWSNYFRPYVSSKPFNALDHWMNLREYRYARFTHPTKPRYWLRSRYWGRMNPQRKIAGNQGYICQICGDSLFNGEELHLHHQQWRSKGGTNTYRNLAYRHLYCHQRVHAQPRQGPEGSE